VSIAVAIDDLAEAVARFDFAYLVTIGDDGRPHVVAVSPQVRDAGVVVGELGRKTRANLAARPAVTLVWPPRSADEHSLIVDGSAELDGDTLTVTVSRAVLHRPAPAPAPGACDSDCVELPTSAAGT
jgi:hypothetical protein